MQFSLYSRAHVHDLWRVNESKSNIALEGETRMKGKMQGFVLFLMYF